MDKKLKVDGSIIRHLIVKYNKLDTDNEYFNKDKVKIKLMKKKVKISKKGI